MTTTAPTVTLTLEDLTTITVPEHLAHAVVGVDADGHLLLPLFGTGGATVALTPCCYTTGERTGFQGDYAVCRECRSLVDPKHAARSPIALWVYRGAPPAPAETDEAPRNQAGDLIHTCNGDNLAGLPWGRKAPEGECARCDELRAGAEPRARFGGRQTAAQRDADACADLAAHFASPRHVAGQCGIVCTYGQW